MKKYCCSSLAVRNRINFRRWAIALRRKKNCKSSGIDDKHQVIVAPEQFSLSKNAEEVLKFIKELRDATLKKSKSRRRGKQVRRNLHIDLSSIKSISLPAVVILAAELDRWRIVNGVRLGTRDIEKWEKDVVSRLDQLGFFDLLEVDKSKISIPHDSTERALKLKSALRSDGQVIQKFLDEVQSKLNIKIPQSTKARPYESIQEAIENSLFHAYSGRNSTGYQWAGKRCWQTAVYDSSTNIIRLFIYDQGIGIPESISRSDEEHNKNLIENLISAFIQPSDAQIIDSAFSVGKTSKNISGSGHGMSTMHGLLGDNEEAYIRVISGTGDVIKKKTGNSSLRTFPAGLGGTLVEWCLPLPDAGTSNSE